MSTTAQNLFEDVSVQLTDPRTRDAETGEFLGKDSTLYIDYNFADKGIRLSIYSDTNSPNGQFSLDIELDKIVTNLATATAVLKQIAADYPGKLKVKSFLPVWDVFFRAVDGAVEITSPVADTDGSDACEACGTVERNDFTFLYVPAVPDSQLYDASVSLHWEFGCYGGLTVEGALDDVEVEAREILGRMLMLADDDYKPAVKAALAAL